MDALREEEGNLRNVRESKGERDREKRVGKASCRPAYGLLGSDEVKTL